MLFLLLNTKNFRRNIWKREDLFGWWTFNNGETNRHGLNFITKKRFTRKKCFGSIKGIAFLKAEAFSGHLNRGPMCLWNETLRLTWHKDVNEDHLHAFDIRFECFHISFKILIYFCKFPFVDVFYFAYMFSSLKYFSFLICVSCHSRVHSVMRYPLPHNSCYYCCTRLNSLCFRLFSHVNMEHRHWACWEQQQKGSSIFYYCGCIHTGLKMPSYYMKRLQIKHSFFCCCSNVYLLSNSDY